jgi:hypothetical protein
MGAFRLGSHAMQLVADEEGVVFDAHISDSQVRTPTCAIELSPIRVVRSLVLAESLIRVPGAVRDMATRWLAATHEHQVVCRATMGERAGWAISEVVDFPGACA